MATDTHKVVMCKIPREEFTRFQQYCDMNDETSNACLKRIISENIDNPQPAKIAGKSVFEYNKQKDNFSWKVLPYFENEILSFASVILTSFP